MCSLWTDVQSLGVIIFSCIIQKPNLWLTPAMLLQAAEI